MENIYLYAMEQNVTGLMTSLIFQISIIIFAVKVLGTLTEKIGVPSVIGELLAGVIIGPFALGGIPFPGFPDGLFPVASPALSVSPQLYGFAMVASIILLFNSGLETDLGMFLRYAVAGSIIGISGVVFSFLFGAGVCMILMDTHIYDARCLFFGIMSTATSVGITARILSDRKRMDSPEGVTILAAAVFDDVLGIVLLAVVMGIVTAVKTTGGHGINSALILNIAFRAFGIWLGFSAVALLLSKKIAKLLKKFHNTYDFSIMALGISLLLAGVFEKQGLAMIIGAYITGLALSGTDIAPIVHEKLEGLSAFFVPLFFCVMGMMVNVGKLMNTQILVFGGIYTLACIVAKLIGCGWPALYLGFNLKGSLRIGSGMVPRGEVALIIAGIGITSGILSEELFGVVILMTLVTTVIAPPALNFLLNVDGRGTKKAVKSAKLVNCHWEFKTEEFADLVTYMLRKTLRKEGFFVLTIDREEGIYHARMNGMVFSIHRTGRVIDISTKVDNEGYIKTVMYEVMLRFMDGGNKEQNKSFVEVKKDLAHSMDRKVDLSVLKNRVSEDLICTELVSDDKEGVLEELVSLAYKDGSISDKTVLLNDIIAREQMMSTGMENGIAFPHAKSECVKNLTVAIGIKKGGIEFGSLDGKPSQIFVLIASPKESSSHHLQVLAAMTAVLSRQENIDKVLNASCKKDIIEVFKEHHER